MNSRRSATQRSRGIRNARGYPIAIRLKRGGTIPTAKEYQHAPSVYQIGPGGYGPLFCPFSFDPKIDVDFYMVREWFDYFINAPLWNDADDDQAALLALRSTVDRIRDLPELKDWYRRCLEIGLDPLWEGRKRRRRNGVWQWERRSI